MKKIASVFVKKGVSVFLDPFIWMKFLLDKKSLNIDRDAYRIYRKLHVSYWLKFFRFPDLVGGDDYNQVIQRLKLTEHSPIMIDCVDKVKVRDYVESCVGPGYLPEIYQVADDYSGLRIDTLPDKFVLKTNHDSGTVILVRDKSCFDGRSARKIIERSLGRTFGINGGEWPYWYVAKKVFAEEYIGNSDSSVPPPDYKFHCVNGRVQWLQYIYDRGAETKEVMVDSDGEFLDIHFDENMLMSRSFQKPDCFERMKDIAEQLAKPFKYVRVDMYLVDGCIYVGELTFFPMYGCYKGSGQKALGKYMHGL